MSINETNSASSGPKQRRGGSSSGGPSAGGGGHFFGRRKTCPFSSEARPRSITKTYAFLAALFPNAVKLFLRASQPRTTRSNVS